MKKTILNFSVLLSLLFTGCKSHNEEKEEEVQFIAT